MAEPRPKKGQHGGARKGAGRPEGSTNALPLGAIRALRALRHRVPEGTPDELADLAGTALERIRDVLDERVDASMAGHVLKAAAMAREEVCGPLAQKVQVGGEDGGPLRVAIAINRTVRPG